MLHQVILASLQLPCNVNQQMRFRVLEIQHSNIAIKISHAQTAEHTLAMWLPASLSSESTAAKYRSPVSPFCRRRS
jgi:hypothetical protein